MKIERVERITIAESVIRELEKLKDKELEKKFKKQLLLFKENPFHNFLKTHPHFSYLCFCKKLL